MGSVERRLRRGPERARSDEEIAAAISELRRQVLEARELAQVFDHFEDALMWRRAFLAAGRVARHGVLISIIDLIARQIAGLRAPSDAAWLVSLAEHDLWHGVLHYRDDRMAVVIYFTDVNRGVVALPGTGSDSWVHFIRFSIPPELTEPVDPESATLVGCALRRDAGQC